MTLEEKVGAMMHGSLPAGDALGHDGATYDVAEVQTMIDQRHLNSFITRLVVAPRQLAEQNNAIQRLAGKTRLGIPVTISTDPRNHFQAVLGASTAGGGFSLWPETLGLAATGDVDLVRRFGDIARREYRAVGIHMALSPQADLASEPRWPRVTATFGSDPAAVSRMVEAYVEGFQGGNDGVRRDGVATVVKHWVGYGAEPEGFDGHNVYGRVARLDDASFARHVAAFDGAFAAKVTGVMPTYPILEGVTLDGKTLEPVAAGFNKQILTDLLRGRKGFQGLVLSDWAITNNCDQACTAPTAERPQEAKDIGMPWGVESLTQPQRFAKGVMAGIDQFGGVNDGAMLMQAVREGMVPTERLDEAVSRIMRLKFELGLFDNPYVDPDAAERVVGDPASQVLADMAQRKAQVILEDGGKPMTAQGVRTVWLYNVAPDEARRRGWTVVSTPAEADLAIVRVNTPFERLHPHHFFGARQNEGRLDFRDGDVEYEAIKQARAARRSIVAINLDRPAILTNVRDKVDVLIATFGASDAAVLDVATGQAKAEGRLPFELPSSMASVEAQDPARPDDSAAPLYPYGYGLGVN
ncbi:MAG: glycoside hydrolase family 3 N-terminal domain-containing protein [Brevundimonas sp.]|uniref:glycoside hydrolase family 3 protein n=1 Tax=Brevundimonas sp. TaxID=1871086 RepID=UPI0028D1D615|nr:glycoside hydrolase family 3 N-terminal domain-containing protein [uncultured Brevundimonas sp.]